MDFSAQNNEEICRFPDFTKRVAGIRELFEECNILLARNKEGKLLQHSQKAELETLRD